MNYIISFQKRALFTALALLVSSPLAFGDTFNLHNWKYSWWENTRAERQADHDQHLADQPENFYNYRSTPSGSVGIPTIIFRLFPYVLPEIWGPPESNWFCLDWWCHSCRWHRLGQMA